MNLTAETKVKDVLAQYPWMSEELPKYDERLAIINNPLARALLGSATLQTAADQAGMSVNDIIGMLKRLVKEHEDPGIVKK